MTSLQQTGRHPKGLSLIELMIGLLLATLVLAGVITVFGSSRTAYQMGAGNARLQENIRFALELMKPPIREAAVRAFCAGRVELNNHLNEDCAPELVELFVAEQSIHGWEFTGTAPGNLYTIQGFNPTAAQASDWSSFRNSTGDQVNLPQQLVGRVVPGSDVLVLRTIRPVPGITGCTGNVRTAPRIETCDPQNPVVPRNHGLLQNQIVLVTNCATAGDLFQNRSASNANFLRAETGTCASPGPGNRDTIQWAHAYRDDAQLQAVDITAYYIGFNAARGQPGLYRLVLSGPGGTSAPAAEELVEGIENMQLLFGVSMAEADSNNDGRSVDEWLSADRVPRWDRVISIRVGLLARSPDPADPQAVVQDFNLNDVIIRAQADRRLRQAAFTTIAFRNRVLVP